MSTFWSWYITLLTVGTLLALSWLIFATRKSEVHKNNRSDHGSCLRWHRGI